MDKEEYQDFIERLAYWNKGEGVNDHATANPLFIVQENVRVYGIDADFTDKFVWCTEDGEVELEDSEIRVYLEDEEIRHDEFDVRFDNQITRDDQVLFARIGYIDNWSYVNSHFTREGAEAFIARKKHDYKELRIYVDSQYWCWEFNDIVLMLLDGRLKLATP